jgi:hypothetical protein
MRGAMFGFRPKCEDSHAAHDKLENRVSLYLARGNSSSAFEDKISECMGPPEQLLQV